jgi:hypothetical protein
MLIWKYLQLKLGKHKWSTDKVHVTNFHSLDNPYLYLEYEG